MDISILQETGLTKWEAKTYTSLLELGSTTTGPLVKKCGVPQSKIYGVLESLNKKGLASYIIKGKTKYFQATEPKKILALFREKQLKLQKLIPELEAKQELAKEKKSVELFEGLKSIRNMLIDLISDAKKQENWYGFSTGIYPKEAEEFYEWWGTKKHNSGIKDHLLISAENKKTFLKSISKQAIPFVKKVTRYSKVSFPGDTAVFRDKVIIFNWEDIPTATLITSKNLSEQYKNFFIELWKTAKS